MRIVGSWTPNSAAAERVFSLLKAMFGDEQLSTLVDMIETALALKYNERKVGSVGTAFEGVAFPGVSTKWDVSLSISHAKG